MSKTPSNKLFNLIKSLNGPEKRYFKLFARNNSSQKSSKYLQLFEAIDAQDLYDDGALIHSIYAGAPIESRKFSELKAYLYEMILKVLQGYDENSSIDFRLKRMLQSVQVLYRRSHYGDCRELLQKARKLAAEFEAFNYFLEILHWEKQVAFAETDISFLDRELERIENEEEDCLKKLNNISAYQNLFYRMMVSIRKDALVRSEEKVKQLESFMQHPLLQSSREALTYRSRILYHRIYGLYYYSIIDYPRFYESNKKFLALLEENPRLLKENVSAHISALSNFALSCGLLAKYQEVEEILPKFLKIKPVTQDDEFIVNMQYHSIGFSLCVSTGDFDRGLDLIKNHQKGLKKFKKKSAVSSSIYHSYFYIYFGAGNYDKALEYLNKWLNMPRSEEREDLQSLARILNLIIHYEMENTVLLEYLFRSSYRFLKKRNRLFNFERSVLSFIRDSGKTLNRQEIKKAFQSLKSDFERLSEIPSEKVIFQYFDFISWLESKISNRSFGEVLKEKYLNSIEH